MLISKYITGFMLYYSRKCFKYTLFCVGFSGFNNYLWPISATRVSVS